MIVLIMCEDATDDVDDEDHDNIDNDNDNSWPRYNILLISEFVTYQCRLKSTGNIKVTRCLIHTTIWECYPPV